MPTISPHVDTPARRTGLGIVLVALMLLFKPGLALAQYTFTVLDVDFPSSKDVLFGCAATGINDTGSIIGGCNDANQSDAFRGFLFDGRKFTEVYFPTIKGSAAATAQTIYQYAPYVHRQLPLLMPTTDAVIPQDVNIRGQLTGWFSNSPSGLQGFVKVNGIISNVAVPGADLTEATGINDAGHVVGDYRGADGVFHGFLFANGAFTTFGTDLGAHDINNAEQIVGCYALCSHGFLYDGSTFTSIDVPGAVVTQATGINDFGQIVGTYYDGTTLHGFVYDGTTFTPVDAPGAFLTTVNRINNNGAIVGFYEVQTSPGVIQSRAFVATR